VVATKWRKANENGGKQELTGNIIISKRVSGIANGEF